MPGKLTEIEEAVALVLARAEGLGSEPVALREALGRVLAQDVIAPEAVPGFDNSAMDGFAVRANDLTGASEQEPGRLRVVAESRAGHPASAVLGEGEAIAISTGAMVPEGADAVVQVEDTTRAGDTVTVLAAPERGLNIRRAGEDIEAGRTVLFAGAPIGPAEQGVLASCALSEVECARRPRVAVVVSGDELIEAGEEMRPGAVRDSNAYTVPALALAAGAEIVEIGHARDDAGATREAIGRALEADLTAITGGVSVGEHDHVKKALADLGAQEVFWGVALRPGKPTWFGTAGRTLAFGLPGNPVSAMVTFILFARPALLAMQGREPDARRAEATLASSYEKQPGRAHALRCRLEVTDAGLIAHTPPDQGSHVLTSMLGADALAVIPAASRGAAAGERVAVELLPGFDLPTMGR